MPDKALAERLQARRGYPHGAGAVRSEGGAERNQVVDHSAKIPVRTGA